MKNSRFGQGFAFNKATNSQRLAMLIMFSSLANWPLMVLGMVANLDNRHRHYQANATKTSNILSACIEVILYGYS